MDKILEFLNNQSGDRLAGYVVAICLIIWFTLGGIADIIEKFK